MDDEFVQMIKYILKGVPVRKDTLALNVIKDIGPFKDYLSHEHTYQNMREHQTQPRFIDRKVREFWETAGKTSIYDRAWVEASRILETHRPDPLPQPVQDTLREIVVETEKEMGVHANS